MAPSPRSHPARRAALAAAALVAAACNDPIRPQASLSVESAALTVTALTGTSANARSALLLIGAPAAASPENAANGDFHVVLDLNAAGQPVVYPAGLVSSVAARRVGVRRLEAPYDSLMRAPTGGYSVDSALTVRVGETVGVQVPGGAECQFAPRPHFFSKLVVDSVRARDRVLLVRVTTNPNCGFRSFAAGVPRD